MDSIQGIENIYLVRIKYLPDNTYKYYESHYDNTYGEDNNYFGRGVGYVFHSLQEAEDLLDTISEDIENENFSLFNNNPEDYDLDSIEIIEFVPMTRYFRLPL